MANKNSLRRLFSDTIIYGMSSIVGRFLNYLLVPLYTYKIAAASGGYGVVTNIYAYTALLLVVLIFGMETTFFYFGNKHREKSDRVFATAFTLVGSVAALFLALVLLFLGPVSGAIGYGDHPEYIGIMATVVALDAIQAIPFTLLRFQNRPIKFAFLKLLNIVCSIGLNLFVFIAAPKLGLTWFDNNNLVLYIFVVNLICTSGITFFFIPEFRLLRAGIDRSLVKEMLRYTWPLLLLGLVGILNQVADKICYRFLVPGEEGDRQLGIYGACAKIAMIMAMITQAFRYAYEPFVFGSGKGKESKESQAMVMKYFIMFTLLAFLAVIAYMDVLRFIISPDYWEGLSVVPIVMMAEIFMGIYFNLSFWYKLIAKTWWGAIMSACGCAVLLAVNILFVPRYGYVACAWGGFCGYAVCMTMSWFIGQRKNPVPYPVGRILLYFAVAMGMYAAMHFVQPEALWMRLAFNTMCLIAFAAFILFMERDLVQGLLGLLKRKKD